MNGDEAIDQGRLHLGHIRRLGVFDYPLILFRVGPFPGDVQVVLLGHVQTGRVGSEARED